MPKYMQTQSLCAISVRTKAVTAAWGMLSRLPQYLALSFMTAQKSGFSQICVIAQISVSLHTHASFGLRLTEA